MTLRFLGGGLAALMLLSGPALAQRTPLYQDGTITPHHITKYTAQGRTTDAGGVNGDSQGRGVAPFAVQDNGAPAVCANNATTAGQYQAFCLGHDSSGNPQLTVDSYGGLDAKALNLKLNGVDYPFPFTATSSVVGPNSTTSGYLATYNNTNGTLLGQSNTALLDAQGLNVAKGTAPVSNNTSYTAQFVHKGTIDANKSSAAIYTLNEYNGNDVQANAYGVYGTIWYNGTAGNQGMGVKGNFYTYTTASSLLGAWPHEYFTSPNMGTLTYAAGVYGRPAHYLPGTITYAASIMADGIYNISTPAGGAVTNFANLLATGPYAADASNNYVLLSTGGSCSPTCYTATIQTLADPLVLKTAATDLDIRLQPGRRVAVDSSAASAIAGTGNQAAIYIYYSAGADAYIDAITNNASTSALHMRSYGGGGLYNDILLDQVGTLRLAEGLRTVGLSGSGNTPGVHLYQTINGNSYVDSISSGGFSTELHLRTYNNGTYYDSYVDASGRLRVGGQISSPSAAVAASSAEQQAIIWLSSTDASTKARYGVLGTMTYQPAPGATWSSTLEGAIGLAYMQGAGTHDNYVFGVGGTAFLCDGSIAPLCSGATIANSTGFLAGVYGSAEMGGAGTASWLIGLFADGANNIVHSGTATNNASIYVTRPTAGTNRYGVYFSGGAAPANGSLAANADITIKPGNVNAVVFQNALASCGGEIFSTNSGTFYAGLGTDCSIAVTPTGTGIATIGTTTAGSFGLRYGGTAAAVPGSFSATHYIPIVANGTTYYIPAKTSTW